MAILSQHRETKLINLSWRGSLGLRSLVGMQVLLVLALDPGSCCFDRCGWMLPPARSAAMVVVV